MLGLVWLFIFFRSVFQSSSLLAATRRPAMSGTGEKRLFAERRAAVMRGTAAAPPLSELPVPGSPLERSALSALSSHGG